MLQKGDLIDTHYTQYDVGGCVLCISKRAEYILTRNRVIKILPKKLHIDILTDLLNAINKMLSKILFHKHFKAWKINNASKKLVPFLRGVG